HRGLRNIDWRRHTRDGDESHSWWRRVHTSIELYGEQSVAYHPQSLACDCNRRQWHIHAGSQRRQLCQWRYGAVWYHRPRGHREWGRHPGDGRHRSLRNIDWRRHARDGNESHSWWRCVHTSIELYGEQSSSDDG